MKKPDFGNTGRTTVKYMNKQNRGTVLPVVITDKNGKITTVRKRVGGSPTSSLSVAVPSVSAGASKAKDYKPTKAQLKPEMHHYQMTRADIDPRFHQFLPHGQNTVALNIRASDEEMYEALSKFNTVDNALCYLFINKEGVRLSDDDKELVESIADHDETRSSLMQEAYERRISSYNFIAFHRRFASSSNGPGNYLDAAHVQSIPSLEKTPGLTHKVYKGAISLEDIMEVGVQAVRTGSRHGDAKKNLDRLESLKDGSADFTAKQYGAVLAKCKSREIATAILTILDDHGGEFAASIVDPQQANSLMNLCREEGIEDYRPVVEYANKFKLEDVFRNHAQIFRLYKAGVDVDFAIEKSRRFDEYTVQQVIALHEGIASPVTDGWL